MTEKIILMASIIGIIIASYILNRKRAKNRKPLKAIHLTRDEFLARVADYKATPDGWRYLGDKPAIIDFYAGWCAPCKALSPILEELAEEYENEIYIYKIDTEQERELTAVFGISSLPTLMFIPMQGTPHWSQGAMPMRQIREEIEKLSTNQSTKA